MRVNLISDEQRQQNREMDVGSLARYVFRQLKENLVLDHNSREFFSSVRELRQSIFPGGIENNSCSDHTKLVEAIILLEKRGLLARDFSHPLSYSGENRFVVYLTSVGIKSDIQDEILLLVDEPEEIVGALEQKVGNLDEVVRQYYLESLRAYQEGLYISSVICLGAASERAILWLAESIESFCSKYQQPIQKRRRNISDLTKYLSGSILSDIFPNDATFETELRKRLVLLGDLYRENRNEAGHPKTVDQSWLGEDQEILLIHFRRYITTICKAVERLKKQSAS